MQKIHQTSRNFEKNFKGKEAPKMRDLRASIFPYRWKPFLQIHLINYQTNRDDIEQEYKITNL